MKRRKRMSFDDLVMENKRQLLSDKKAIEKLEEKIEKRHMQKAE